MNCRQKIVALLCLAASSVIAAPPATLHYQGQLTNASSMPVNGSQLMTFRLYAAATGGIALFTETQTVSVSNGLFAVRLGETSALNLPFDAPYFLGISVGTDAEMTPRQPLSSSAYAFRAGQSDALASSASVAGSQITGSITTATIPAANVVGGVGGGGTVTSVATGIGLTGGTITSTGSIGLAATNLLPTTACTANQITKWNGTAWACASDDGLPAGGFAGQVLAGSVSGPAWSNSLSVAGNLSLPATSATNGRLLLAGQSFLHGFGSGNTFLGTGAGNFSLTGTGNTATGTGALASATTATDNVASGRNALFQNTTGRDNVALGINTLTSNATGNNNVAVGQNALFFSVGDSNTALGNNAGASLTAGNNNIYVANPGVSVESDTLRIGNGMTRAFIDGIRGVTPSGASPLPVVIDALGQLGTGAADGGGTVTSVATGAGLTGGPITASGTIGLAATNLLPTTACSANQIPKWSGTAWVCAADADSNSGGTVTSVATGAGLTGGAITGSGTIGLAATNLLPTTACALNQIPRWNGGAWTCSTSPAIPALPGTPYNVLIADGSAANWSSTPIISGLSLANNLTLTQSSRIEMEGVGAFLHSTGGASNLFVGASAGNLGVSGAGENTALGYVSMNSLTTGTYNVAVGAQTLRFLDTGGGNTAIGYGALYQSSASRNVAIGESAMGISSTGDENTAVGWRALRQSVGTGNVAVGFAAGSNLLTGSRNILVAHSGVANESNTLRIGSVQDRAFIAGIHNVTPGTTTTRVVSIDANGQLATEGVAAGLGTSTPENRLHVAESIDGTGTPANHVMQVENTSTGSSPDVLALRVRTTGNPGTGVNFITFYDGDYVTGAGGADSTLGSIQGNGAGGVEFASAGNDFAEYLQKRDPNEALEPGDVIGVIGGKVSRDTNNAEHIMVVSTGAIVAGNDPGEAKRHAYALTAFIGQADIKVRGAVKAGDYLITSGAHDGMAVAISPDALTLAHLKAVVGRAWASSSEADVKPVRSAVGLERHNTVMLSALKKLENENAALRADVAAIKAALGMK